MTNSLLQRLITFGQRQVLVQYEGDRSQRLIDYLFADVPDDDSDSAPAHQTLALNRTEPTGSLTYVDQYQSHLHSEGLSDGAVANALLGDVIYHLADRCDTGMMFHAGAVTKDNVCIILPGQSGAGKTSVTAWLTQSGYHYITDELIYVELHAGELAGFTRPFNFKTPVLGYIKKDIGIDAAQFPDYRCDFATLIPHRSLNPAYLGNRAPVHSVIFPQFTPGSEGTLQLMSSAQTALGLMACLVNGRNLEEHGFRAVTQLARAVTGFQLQYCEFAQIDALISEHGF